MPRILPPSLPPRGDWRASLVVLGVFAALSLGPATASALPDGSFGSNCGGCHPGNGIDAHPSTPTSFAASDNRTDAVRLTWSDPTPTKTIRYELFRSTGSSFPGGSPWQTVGPFTYPNTTSSRQLDDSSASAGTTYFYWVRSANAGYMSSTASDSGLRVLPPSLSCPANLSITLTVGAVGTQTFSCTNTGGGSISYAISDDAPWLDVAPPSGSPGTLHTATFSAASLAPGSYGATITVNGGAAGAPTISVALTVLPALASVGGFSVAGAPQSAVDQTTDTVVPLVVSSEGPIQDLDVSVKTSAVYADNLIVSLVHDGVSAVLYQGTGDTSGAQLDALFDDEASAPAPTTGSAVGSFKPSPGALSAFDGMELSGLWELHIVDGRGIVDGTALLSWSLSGKVGLVGRPLSVAVYDDPAFVDTAGSNFSESDNVQASLAAIGHAVSRFDGTSAAAFQGALAGADVLLIPELEVGSLNAAIAPGARAAIASFVSAGGTLVVHGDGAGYMSALLNSTFGWSTVQNFSAGVATIAPAAAGTRFQGGPGQVANNNAIYEIGGLPAGAKTIYQDSTGGTEVASVPFGSGRVVYLAYDWFDAAPVGAQDGGWLEVLARAVLPEERAIRPRSLAVFDDNTYVDSSSSAPNAESDNLQATLAALGHQVSRFDGIGAASFASALAGARALVVPELENGDLGSALDPAAVDTIHNYVTQGGVLVAFGDYSSNGISFLNRVFGWALTDNGSSTGNATLASGPAVGTRFREGIPTIVATNNATHAFASLPAEMRSLYDASNGTVVAWAPVGAGRVVLLGWDWFDATPIGAQDGGWVDVLGRAIEEAVADPEPELSCSPASLPLRTATSGGANPASTTFTCKNTGGGTHHYSVSAGASWLSVTPAPAAGLGAGASFTHTVTYDISGLAVQAAPYATAITAKGSWQTQSIAASLRIDPPPALSCSPTNLPLRTATAGGANPASTTFTCTNTGGGTLSYSVSEGVSWLSVTPAPAAGLGAGASFTHTVTYDISGVAAQAAPYTTTITAAGGAQSVGISASLRIDPPPALSCSPGSLSPTAGAGQDAADLHFSCTNTGGGSLSYTTSVSYGPTASGWLSIDPPGGSGQQHTVHFDTDQLLAGAHSATIMIDAGAAGVAHVSVDLSVVAAALEIGDLLVSDFNNGRVLHVDPVTGLVTVLSPRAGAANLLVSPTGLVVRPSERVLYVLDAATNAVVAIDLVTGLQTLLAPLGPGHEPWGLASGGTGKLYVGAPASSQLLDVSKSGAAWLPSVVANDPRLANAYGIDVLAGGQVAVACGASGLLVYVPASGLQKFAPAPGPGLQVVGVRAIAGTTLYTELQDDCAPAAAALRGFEPPAQQMSLATAGLLRCPLAIDAIDANEIFVADTASLAGGDARVVRAAPNGAGPYAQTLVAALPDGSQPTLPADISILSEAVPEPGPAPTALTLVGVLCWLGRRAPRRRRQRPDQRSHAEAARPQIASNTSTRSGVRGPCSRPSTPLPARGKK